LTYLPLVIKDFEPVFLRIPFLTLSCLMLSENKDIIILL
jgi:hypothetical protein